MIASVFPGGKSFKDSISYNETGKGGLQRKEDRVEWEWYRNLPTRDSEVAACMMAATANAAVRGTAKPVYHFSVSLHPDDPVGPDIMQRIAERTLRDIGLEEHEAAVWWHKDRSHPHLQFVVNRVHPERRTVWKPWRDFYRLERSMRAQERELGLRVVPGYLAPAFEPEHAIEGHEPEPAPAAARLRPQPGPKRGDDAFLRDVTERATPVLQRASSWAELERGLAEEGLSIRVKGGGFRITGGRHDVKASAVGREFSRNHLEKRFGPYPDYRARMAVGNGITPASRAVLRTPERQAPPAEAIPSSTSEPPSSASESPATIPAATAPPASSAEQSSLPEPQVERPEIRFLRDVKQRATPVLKHAQSWVELQYGLMDKGLILCVKGGGFVVTDGEREVKASDIGRPFSRFHLEKRLGRYPEPSVPAEPRPGGSAAAPPADPVTDDVPSAAPQLSAVATPPGQDETDDSSQFEVAPQLIAESPQLTLPFGSGTAPRSQPLEAIAGVVHHPVTQEETDAETPGERLAAPGPARPAQPVSTSTHALDPAEQTTAASPAQLDLLVEVEASPARRDQTNSPELTTTERLPPADGLNQLDLPLVSGAPQLPLPARPTAVDLPPASAPVQGELTLETAPTASPSRSPRDPQSATVPRAQPPGPAGPVRETPPAHSAPPPRTRSVQQKSAPAPAQSPGRPPPTRRELYRDARRAFGRALAKVYVDPHAARREFAGYAYHRGPEEAVKRLQLEPHRFDRLRPGSRVEDAAAAARVGALYARYQIDRVSAGLIHRLPELQVAARAKVADQQILRARTLAETVKREHDRLRARVHDIAAADGLLLESARKIYRNPDEAMSALKRHYQELVQVNAGEALRRMSLEIEARPELFGALRSSGDGIFARAREAAGLGDFSAARGQVPMLAKYFEHRAELGMLPSQARISAAAADAAAARDAVESVEEIRRTISPQPVSSLVRSVAPDLKRVLRQVGRVELERKLSAMLPADTLKLATDVVSTVIELAEGPDREGQGPEV